MSKIRCVLIDDEPVAIMLLRTYCEQLEDYCEVVGTFFSAEEFLKKQIKLEYDLLMLDIDMTGMKGTDLARILSDKSIVFVTGRDIYDQEVLDLQLNQENIVARIRKPLDKDKVEKALNKYLSYKRKRNSVVLPTNNGQRNISLDDVLLITTKEDGFKQGVLSKHKITGKFDPRNKLLITRTEVLLVYQTDFPALNHLLPSDSFIQINRSTIVSRKAIYNYDTEGISFIPELKGSISTAHFNVTLDSKEFKLWYRR